MVWLPLGRSSVLRGSILSVTVISEPSILRRVLAVAYL
jgi:hypothetical protein